MSELKPCPFCGEMPKVNTWTMHGITESRCFCDNEKCPVYLSKTIAIDDWNTRPIEDALNARLAELEAERRWIPVSERLPEDGREVLVYEKGFIFLICRQNGKWVNDDSGAYWLDLDNPTYWMPLPELPEVK